MTINFGTFLKDYLEDNNISEKEFANRIDITPQYLNGILNGKKNLSKETIIAISLVTDIETDMIMDIESNYQIECAINRYLDHNHLTIDKYLNKFNFKYLKDNKIIDFLNIDDKSRCLKDILKYLRVSNPEQIEKLTNKTLYKSKNDKPELLALWLEMCYRDFLKQNIAEYKSKNIDSLVAYIKEEASKNSFNQTNLIKKFNELGVGLVIKDDLPNSKIRGAFRVYNKIPVIFITTKYKRIADIYFTLLHEIAHLKSDYNTAQAKSVISYDDKGHELKTDKLAFNWMVEDSYYNHIKNDKTYDIEKEKTYPKSFIVYRLAQDNIIKYNSKIYQKYNIIIKL